jgi:hypothetical protein
MCQVETVLAEFGTSQRFLIPCLNNGIYLVKFARSPVPIHILVIREDRIEFFILNSGPLIMEPWSKIGDRGRKQVLVHIVQTVDNYEFFKRRHSYDCSLKTVQHPRVLKVCFAKQMYVMIEW